MRYTEQRIVHRPPGELRASKNNARRHRKKQVKRLIACIEQFGFLGSILITPDGEVISGHARLEAAKALGMETVPCIVVTHLTEAQRRAFMIADNRLAELAEWDNKKLAEEFSVLLSFDIDLELTGFDQPAIDLIINQSEGSAGSHDEHLIPPIPEGRSVTKPGQIWHLGPHTLYVGDAKSEGSYHQLLWGQKAAAAFTDPPYNLSVASFSGKGNVKHREFLEASGEMPPAAYLEFLEITLGNMTRHCRDGAIAYVMSDWRHLPEMFEVVAAVAELLNLCVWVKSNGGMGALYRSQHEMCLVAKIGKSSATNNVKLGSYGRNRTNVWNYPGMNSFRAGRMKELRLHPTVKPVSMVADAILDTTQRGDIILDPFGGSGTTLLAADKTGRRARLIEIDPLYCDVTIRRWQQLTGGLATSGSGISFDEMEGMH